MTLRRMTLSRLTLGILTIRTRMTHGSMTLAK
jgi:hypothetical protein